MADDVPLCAGVQGVPVRLRDVGPPGRVWAVVKGVEQPAVGLPARPRGARDPVGAERGDPRGQPLRWRITRGWSG